MKNKILQAFVVATVLLCFPKANFGQAPVITTQPSSQSVCSGGSVSFLVVATGSGLNFQWRKGLINLSNGPNISGATTSTLTINPAGAADAAVNYNVVITGSVAPSATSNNVSLVVNPVPVTPIVTNDGPVCAGGTIHLTTTLAINADYNWTGPGGFTSSIQNPVLTSVTSAMAGTYSLTLTNTTSGCVSAPGSTIVLVFPIPAAPTAGSNSPVCSGGPILLTSSLNSGGTYSWVGPNSFTSTNQNPTVGSSLPIMSGGYILTVSKNGCTSQPDTVQVLVRDCQADLEIVKSVDNPNPKVGDNVVFTIVVSNKGNIDATGVTVTDFLQAGYTFVSSIATSGTYDHNTTIWLVDTLAAGSSATLTITVKVNENGVHVNTASVTGNEVDFNMGNNVSTVETFPTKQVEFFISEGFSPNGDNINDLYTIRGIDRFPSNKFTVFNRWGSKVFEETGYNNTWDGKAKSGMMLGGNELPSGTYFYILDLGDGSDVKKGTITLNK